MGPVRRCILTPEQRRWMALRYALEVALIVVPITYLASSLMGLLFFSDLGDPLIRAIAPSVGAAIVILIGEYIVFRNRLDPGYGSPSSVDRGRYLTLQLPYHLAFERCLASLSVFGNQCIVLEDRVNGRIEAALVPEPVWRYVFKGQGSRISFRLGSNQEGVTQIVVMSKSGRSTAIFGVGNHEKNVECVAAFLQQYTMQTAVSTA